MGRSTVHYVDNKTNNILKALHNKLRPAGTPVQRVEYIIELLLLRIFEVKLKQDKEFVRLRKLFESDNYKLLFSHLLSLSGKQALDELNRNLFPYYGSILGKARKVFKNNLPQKVQDQLVLIEEVFSNSSFINNVKTGNFSEILSLVSDIEEARLLKTDLLGDAIESALSEQGGTKDVGLYRTPDHVRHMMVTMVDPGFNDIIFDPACGTGGFLFDSFQYVLEKVSKDGKWPGEKGHSEVKKYLDSYIKKIGCEMPATSLANSFYRVGISGIEYLGMIRKMAAINLYIRGLNPQNIEQGDSLDMFDPGVDAGTKSVVIANPPFGAKLDQDAYPNVWEEYPKTDSTTLFVKLMFNHLKKGGRCAVVVSEGFLTWDNEPAKEMRKMLLEEANLRAIISLPQGVFVSKNGQGAKTSILYFEKGEPTKDVWYYKITNDGYSIGVNRKEIADSQIPEILELFTKYVKQGKIPLQTKSSFIIPVDWVKEIDPRLKERIVSETTKQQKEKFFKKRELEIKKLKKRLEKDKITKKQYEEKLWQFDNIVENSIQNEIAKRVEKAHSYSFNLQNYRSNLRLEQIEKWKKAFNGIKIKNGSNIENRYQELKKADMKNALQILASFNPESGLEMDIAREYLGKTEKKDKKTEELEEILKEAQKYLKVPLGGLLKNLSKERKLILDDEKVYFEPTIKTKSNTISISNESKGEGLKVKKRILLKEGDLVVGLLHTQNGAFAICDQEYVSTGTFIPFEINKNEVDPKYLFHNLRTAFENLGVEDATGRENYKVDDILNLQISLPPLEIQHEIVEKIERQKTIIEGAKNILESWKIDDCIFRGSKMILSQIAKIKGGKRLPKGEKFADKKTSFPYIRVVDFKNYSIDFSDLHYIDEKTEKKIKNYKIYQNEIFLSIAGTLGLVGIMPNSLDNANLTENAVKIKVNNTQEVLARYLMLQLSSSLIQDHIRKYRVGVGTPKLPLYIIEKFEVKIPSLGIQKQIIAQLDKEMEALKKVRELKIQAQKRIDKILKEVWGE